MKEIVADAGPLIMFARSGLLTVLRETTGNVLVPATVFEECTREHDRPGAQTIRIANSENLLEVLSDTQSDFPQFDFLDRGEIAVLRLASIRKSPVLMDECRGRRTARQQEIPVIGSAGVLLKARSSGLIEEVGPILHQWKNFGYYYSLELIRCVLEKAGE